LIAIALLGIQAKELKVEIETCICTPKYSYSSTAHNSWKVETTQSSLTDEWINKRWHMHIMEYYSGFEKKKEIPIHTVTQVNLEDITLSEISQIQKDTYCAIPLV